MMHCSSWAPRKIQILLRKAWYPVANFRNKAINRGALLLILFLLAKTVENECLLLLSRASKL